MSKRITIGTRGSKLALWQANFVKDSLLSEGYEVEIEIIKTKGDAIQHLSFDKIEGKGFFTKELEDALLNNTIDLAVHSMKDLPTAMDDRLMIAGVSDRANPADWLIVRKEKLEKDKILKLREGAQVGTSSNRRKALLKHLRPDLQTKDLRGNVPTRLKKLTDGDSDAIVLAAAGLQRLEIDLSEFEVVKLHPREFVPAPAQGVLAYQINRDNARVRQAVQKIHHPEVARSTNVERTILKLLEGGCHLPLGAYCERDLMGYYHVWSAYAESVEEPLRNTFLSYNTTDGLAEAIVANLLN